MLFKHHYLQKKTITNKNVFSKHEMLFFKKNPIFLQKSHVFYGLSQSKTKAWVKNCKYLIEKKCVITC